jgi:rhodanese-related sulfurtransferase
MIDPMIAAICVVLGFLGVIGFSLWRGTVVPHDALVRAAAGRARLIDVRKRVDFDALAGGSPLRTFAANIPLEELEREVSKVARPDEPVILVCKNGVRATVAASRLRSLGYRNVTNVGFGALIEQAA